MRKWGKQGFLNPVDSNDDGWFKFSIRPSSSNNKIQFVISDCSNQIYLEFEPHIYRMNPADGAAEAKSRYNNGLKSINDRRKKIRILAKAIRQMAEKIEESLDESEERLIAEYEKTLEEIKALDTQRTVR